MLRLVIKSMTMFMFWKKSLAGKYQHCTNKTLMSIFDKNLLYKGRFVMIVMTARDGDHMAIMSDVSRWYDYISGWWWLQYWEA